MEVTIKKWGNSLGLRLPSSIAKIMQVSEDSEVQLRISGQKLIVEGLKSIPKIEELYPDDLEANMLDDYEDFGISGMEEIID